jgi:hypothetical protein
MLLKLGVNVMPLEISEIAGIPEDVDFETSTRGD